MKLLNIRIYIILLLTVLISLSGCKSKKNLVTTSGELTEKSQTELINHVLDNKFNYKTISAKGHLELFKSSSSTKVSANYTIIKDEAMQVSIRIPIIGAEAMRIIFTPDSVIMIDRLKKRYVAESIAIAKMIFQFDYYNLQALLTNQLFLSGQKEIKKNMYNKFSVSSDNNSYYMLKTSPNANIEYKFYIDASDRISSTQIASPRNDVTIMWMYENFIQDEQRVYPLSMRADIKAKKQKASFGISYSKLEFDRDVNIDQTISSKYEKVDLKKLLESYMKFAK